MAPFFVQKIFQIWYKTLDIIPNLVYNVYIK